MTARTLAALIAAAVLPAAALAQTADLTVDESESWIAAEICLTPPSLPKRCDTSSSPIGGAVQIALDSYADPGEIVMHDFHLVLTQPLVYNFDWGWLIGTLKITLTNTTASYANPGTPTGPVPVAGDGAFTFPAVEVILTGDGDYVGSGPIIGTLIGSGTFDLAEFGATDTTISGIVAIIAEQVVLAGGMDFFIEGEFEGVYTTIDGAAALLAAGDIPPPHCPADFNGDTVVDTLDFLAFLNAYVAGDMSADFNGDTVVNTLDFIAFLNAFVEGCD